MTDNKPVILLAVSLVLWIILGSLVILNLEGCNTSTIHVVVGEKSEAGNDAQMDAEMTTDIDTDITGIKR